jgi:anti-sigma-K factor RskA
MTGSEHQRLSDELGAYALGALESEEAAEFERHLESCERCRAELRWLQPAVLSLPESVPRQEPPPRLRESLMAEVRGQPEAGDAPAPSRSWRPRLRLAVVLATVLLAAAVVAGYEIGRDGAGGSEASTVSSRQANGVVVKMVREGDGGTLHLANVRQLPSGRVLEAWVRRDGEVEAVPALFVPDRNGRASTAIEDMRGVDTVMVTAEPRGGSEEPTSEPIATMAVPQ